MSFFSVNGFRATCHWKRFKCNFLCHCMFDLGGSPWLGDLGAYIETLGSFFYPIGLDGSCFGLDLGINMTSTIRHQQFVSWCPFDVFWPTSLCGLLKLKAMYTAYGLAAMPFDWIRQGAAGRLWSFLSKLHHGRGKQTPSEQRHDVETSIATICDAKLEVFESMALKFVQGLFHVEIQRSPWWHLLFASTKGSVPFHPAEASAQLWNGHLR